jgi:hypothetical protein
MSAVGIICIYLLPGCVLAGHQGIAHFEGKSIPRIVAFGYDVPKFLIYALIVLLGPLLFGVMVAKLLCGGRLSS